MANEQAADEGELKRLFDAAIELDRAQRTAFLDRECAREARLRARVESLLEAADCDDAFLGGREELGAHGDFGGPGPGTRLGPYLLTDRLGEGGCGVVFAAEQEQPVRRRVALKLLRPELVGSAPRGVLARFEQERQALALMDHPNVARVLDAGETLHGSPFFVMELVPGEPITIYCDRRRLDLRGRLELFQQVCRAVQHAHTKGLIHRDLKPSNVLAHTDADGRAAVKVIDFGIAKALEGPLSEHSLHTEVRQLIGTPEYMSPEQALGDPDIDTRSDVYSLGVLAYELLCGTTPIEPRRSGTAALAEWQRRLLEEDPAPPSRRALEAGESAGVRAAARATDPPRLATGLRRELDWIVLRALEKDRTRRYQSAGELAADVTRHLAGEAIQAAPPGWAYRARKLVRRHRGKVLAAGAVAVALLLGMIATGATLLRLFEARENLRLEAQTSAAHARTAADEARRADAQAAEARLQARVAASVNTLLTTLVARANRAREGGRTDVSVREVMDGAAEELEQRPGSHEPRVEHLLAHTIGEIYRELALFEPAERMLTLSARRAEELFGPRSLEHADALNNLAALFKTMGRPEPAVELYERARAILEQEHADTNTAAERLAAVRINQAALLFSVQRFDGAGSALEGALESLAALGRERTQEFAHALHNLAAVRHRQGDLPRAAELLGRAADLERELFGEGSAAEIETLRGRAVLLVAQGESAAAEATFERALSAARLLRGEQHPQVGSLLENLGLVRLRSGRLDEAVRDLRAAHRIGLDQQGADHPETSERAATLAMALMECADDMRRAEAEQLLVDALRSWTGEQDPLRGARERNVPIPAVAAWNRLARLWIERGAWDQAEELLRAALESAEALLAPPHRQAWMSCALANTLASALTAGAAADPDFDPARLAEAEALLERSTTCLRESATMGAGTRREQLGLAHARGLALHELLAARDPSPERTRALERWRAGEPSSTPR